MPLGEGRQEVEREYILHFYDGSVRRVIGKRSVLQRLNVERIEEVGAFFNPTDVVRRDMERINRALGVAASRLRGNSPW